MFERLTVYESGCRWALAVAMKHRNVLHFEQILAFQQRVYRHYRQHGRDLPWRKTTDPYAILISEIMLQQTQVSRVIEKYELFLGAFPNIESLAQAQLREVLSVWQGLGYNRRALVLKRLAEIVVSRFDSKIPANVESLTGLPGIGKATAGAICAFAFNQPVVFAETNIRSAFIHHFFPGQTNIKDAEVLHLVAQTLDSRNPRQWYWALMDYGAALKKHMVNPGRSSAHYQKQSPFKGSNRQIRGMILQTLVQNPKISEHELIEKLPFEGEAVRRNVGQLVREGFLLKRGAHITVA
jgi:A/G-specific adenine glycosylase